MTCPKCGSKEYGEEAASPHPDADILFNCFECGHEWTLSGENPNIEAEFAATINGSEF